MTDENTTALRDQFWERHPLDALNRAEWEALCDGCGKCCLIKLEDEDSGDVAYTSIACHLFDATTCRCSNYALRQQIVPGCVVLTPENIERNAYWMPPSCAYRRLALNEPLPDWHPLITGDPNSTRKAHQSMHNRTHNERDIPESEIAQYLLRGDP